MNSPAQPPRVEYLIFGPPIAELPAPIEFELMNVPSASFTVESIERVRRHFCRPLWAHSDGEVSENPALDFGNPSIRLSIDFGYAQTVLGGICLPREVGPIDYIEPSHPCEPWTLVVSSQIRPGWHDAIVHEDGRFLLQSVAHARLAA